MNQSDKARIFSSLHVKGKPFLLYNAWDAGSAKAIADAGAKAIATSSWSVAAAQGYKDGEAIPVDLVEKIVARITDSVNLPVTVDFEGGYSDDDKKLGENVTRLLKLGVIGINFEDRVVQGSGLYTAERQAKRISAIRDVADKLGINLFINARTDVFFLQGASDESVAEALTRAKVYSQAGASGLFIPGLTDAALIKRIVLGTELPVNVMIMDGIPSTDRLQDCGIARISYGPIPFIESMNVLKENAKNALAEQVSV